jgi:hypothetical protein
MFLVRVLVFILFMMSPVWAQTNPGFQDGASLCANVPNPACPTGPGLNQVFSSKMDYPGPPIPPTTITSGSTPCVGCTVNGIMEGTSGNVVSTLATVNNGVLVTSGTGVPSMTTLLPPNLTLPSPILLSAPGGQLMFNVPNNDLVAGAGPGSVGVGGDALSGQNNLGPPTGCTGSTGPGQNAYLNVALGAHSLDSLSMTTDACRNVAIGYGSLSSITNGSHNVSIGSLTGPFVSTATYLTCIGPASCQGSPLTGGYDTIIGGFAGNAITSGSRNVIIGFGVGDAFPIAGNDNILFGSNNNCTTYGSFSGGATSAAQADASNFFAVCSSSNYVPLLAGNRDGSGASGYGNLVLSINAPLVTFPYIAATGTGGGGYLCIDAAGNIYRKATPTTCP